MINRRQFIFCIGASLMLPNFIKAQNTLPDHVARLRNLERSSGGRLGAYILNTGNGKSFGWRENERFCHCSTFKLSLAALALHESDIGRLDLGEMLAFNQSEINAYSPVIEANLTKGRLSILELAQAAQITSDNTASNILMRRLGGPGRVTQFWRSIGDNTSRIDGYEPSINVIPPGTEANSTTPRAMAETLRKIVLGDVLTASSRDRLCGWMAATQSGMNRIRAGLPAGWSGMDKTGTGMRPGIGNKTNDLAVLMPPDNKKSIIVTGYFENPSFSEDIRPADESVLKALGEIAVTWSENSFMSPTPSAKTA